MELFSIEKTCPEMKARAGLLTTPHGSIPTPRVHATQGSVEALAPDDLSAIRARILLGNIYHLYLRRWT